MSTQIGTLSLILIAISAIYSGSKAMADISLISQTRQVASEQVVTQVVTQVDDGTECTQTIEMINGESYPTEVCK